MQQVVDSITARQGPDHRINDNEFVYLVAVHLVLVQQGYFFFQRGVPFWRERWALFKIRCAVEESEVDHMAAVW